jgi:TolB-like protein/tetratricopeptide (TPR) repeat protein
MDKAVYKVLRFDCFTLDQIRGCLRVGGQDVDLRPKTFEVLRHLAENAGRLVSKEELFKVVWRDLAVSDDSLVQCIRELRQKLGDDQHRLIKTLSRRGYLLDAAVSVGDARTSADALEALKVPVAIGALEPDPPLPGRPSIAVLPFANLSGDPEQEYLADGIVEDIITALSRCSSLFVIARNSSFTYKGKNVDVRQIGRELGVRYVLEGSVRRAGGRLRITGQLIDARSGAHIWADRFDGDASEVFDFQDRITESVAAAIEPMLQVAEFARLQQKPAANLNAYDLLLRAQVHEYTEEGLTAAIGYLEQALAIDPSYPPALAMAAYCYAMRRQQGWARDFDADTAEGLRLANKAIDYGKDDANVLWMASFVIRSLGRESRRARELAIRSLEINPNSAMALTFAGWAEVFVGRPVQALELLQRAERLSPRDRKAWVTATARAQAHFAAGQFEEALHHARRALAQNPHFGATLRVVAASLAELGRADEAAQAIRRLLSQEPQLTLSKLHSRLSHMDERMLLPFLQGLRKAGLPE